MYVVSLVSLVVLPRKLPPLHQSRHRLNNFLFVAFFAILCTLVSPLELFGDCDLHLCTTSEMSTAQAVPFPASERKTMYRFATYNIRVITCYLKAVARVSQLGYLLPVHSRLNSINSVFSTTTHRMVVIPGKIESPQSVDFSATLY